MTARCGFLDKGSLLEFYPKYDVLRSMEVAFIAIVEVTEPKQLPPFSRQCDGVGSSDAAICIIPPIRIRVMRYQQYFCVNLSA